MACMQFGNLTFSDDVIRNSDTSHEQGFSPNKLTTHSENKLVMACMQFGNLTFSDDVIRNSDTSHEQGFSPNMVMQLTARTNL